MPEYVTSIQSEMESYPCDLISKTPTSTAADTLLYMSTGCTGTALSVLPQGLGGDFFLVHKPERLAQLIVCGAAVSLEVKNLTFIRHKEGGPIALILLQFKKGGKPGLQLHEHCLFDSHGDPTDYYREVYHIQGD